MHFFTLTPEFICIYEKDPIAEELTDVLDDQKTPEAQVDYEDTPGSHPSMIWNPNKHCLLELQPLYYNWCDEPA